MTRTLSLLLPLMSLLTVRALSLSSKMYRMILSKDNSAGNYNKLSVRA